MSHDSSTRVAAAVRQWIATATPGARLPPTRALVAQHGVGPVTVQKALRALVAEGLIETKPGAGAFIRAARTTRPLDHNWQTAALRSLPIRIPPLPAALQLAPNDVLALHSGYPDRELLPERLVRSALARASRGDAAVTRPPASGLPELQAWFATELAAATPTGVTPPAASDVVVLPGSQSGLSTIFRAIVGSSGPLLIESPTYWGAILAAAQAGIRIVPVASGAYGPDPDELDRAFTETGARAFYAQPNFANPTGAQWSAALTDRVLHIVRAHAAFLIEDDWAHDFGITSDVTPLAALEDAGHIIYLRSLTKSVSPAIRIAAVVARGPAKHRILAERNAESIYVSGLLQAAALEVVTQPAWQTYLRTLRQQLAGRRDLLLASLREHAPLAHLELVPAGGLNLWARLPDTTDLDRLVSGCRDDGVLIAAGSEWFPAEPTSPYIRLNYAGPRPECYPDAARIIGKNLKRAI